MRGCKGGWGCSAVSWPTTQAARANVDEWCNEHDAAGRTQVQAAAGHPQPPTCAGTMRWHSTAMRTSSNEMPTCGTYGECVECVPEVNRLAGQISKSTELHTHTKQPLAASGTRSHEPQAHLAGGHVGAVVVLGGPHRLHLMDVEALAAHTKLGICGSLTQSWANHAAFANRGC